MIGTILLLLRSGIYTLMTTCTNNSYIYPYLMSPGIGIENTCTALRYKPAFATW